MNLFSFLGYLLSNKCYNYMVVKLQLIMQKKKKNWLCMKLDFFFYKNKRNSTYSATICSFTLVQCICSALFSSYAKVFYLFSEQWTKHLIYDQWPLNSINMMPSNLEKKKYFELRSFLFMISVTNSLQAAKLIETLT